MRYLVAVSLVLQVCYTGVSGADVAVNQDCSGSGSTCVPADTNVCDPKADTANTCKTKVGKNCVAVTDCIKNAECTAANAPCLCNTDFTTSADNTTCVADGTVINGVCKSDGTCTVGTCDQNAVGGPKCKNKEDENCVAVGSCIKNAECTGANSKCTCNTGFTASTDKTACESAGHASTASVLLLAALFVTSRFL